MDSGGHHSISMTAHYFPSESEKLVSLVFQNPVFILCFHAGENRFNPAFNAAVHAALDAVIAQLRAFEAEGSAPPVALVTCTDPKSRFFSNGIDLEWLMQSEEDSETALRKQWVSHHVLPLLSRFLTLPLPTVAAIHGHAYAGGCLLAMAHDYRVMGNQKGFFCLNELLLPSPLAPGMAALARCKAKSPEALRACVLQAKKYTPQEAFKDGWIDQLVDSSQFGNEEVLRVAVKWATQLSKLVARPGAYRIYSWLKEEIYRDAVHLLAVRDAIDMAKIVTGSRL